MSNEPEEKEAVPEGWGHWGASFRAASPPASFDDVDLDVVRRRAEAFSRRTRRRNAREIAAGALVVLGGIAIATHAPTRLGMLGGVAMALGATIVSLFIVLRARNHPAPAPTAPTREVLAYERAQLERQARLLERVWIWYLAPLLPSIVLIYAESLLRALEGGGPGRNAGIAVAVGLFVATIAFFVWLGRMNARAARKLREQMAKLPPDA
ncbi:Hypothetical protein A7982_03566 [Minicystis rosea]|nr:Hypothetical protein A7982_03566 [Minicystis rosea]